MSARLRSALETENDSSGNNTENITADDQDEPGVAGIVTTEEELEGYQIIRAIAAKTVSPERVIYKDKKSYMGILLNDNNRKPICRLRFNSNQKYIGLFDVVDGDKEEIRVPIDSIADLYQHSDKILKTIASYDN